MRQRVLMLSVCLVISIGAFIISLLNYVSYFNIIGTIKRNTVSIETMSNENQVLSEEFEKLRGDDVPKNLKEILDFLEKYENIQINEIHSFNMKGGGIELIDTITDTSVKVVCDGFEIILTVDDLNKFIAYLDTGKLSYHSADFLFSSNKTILRVRTGGVESGQANN